MARDTKMDNGSYLWRGGRRIALEKETDRFTVMPADGEQLARLKSAPGVHAVQPITNQVFRVETTMSARDAAMSALRSDAYGVVAHHAYRPQGGEGTVYYMTDRIAVRCRQGANRRDIDRLLERYRLRHLRDYDSGSMLLQVSSDSGENPLKIANRLAAEPLVAFAEPNMVNRYYPCLTPTDGFYKRQWHLHAKNGAQLLAAASIDAPTAWDFTTGSRSVVVAVIDDGFDLSHPDFTGNGKVVFPRDYVDGDARPFPTKADDDYHGTPCAGVAIAEANGHGVVGAAFGCAFMPVRFPLSADDDLLIQIFEETGAHADVISCSWGPPPANAPLSSEFADTLTRLATDGGPRGKGVVICFAAANFNAPIDDPVNATGFSWRDYDGNLRVTHGAIVNGNATHPHVVAVAASTSLNRHAAYSNWGAQISVSAPSNNFDPLDDGAFAPGRGIWTTDNETYGSGFTAHSRYTGQFGGTSSATPLTAGVAALVISANPALSAAQVKDILESTADKIVDTTPDAHSGVARGNYDAGGHCDWFGHGKINAGAAVAEAMQRLNAAPPRKTTARKRTRKTARA
jgi:subtilisin family serine protease